MKLERGIIICWLIMMIIFIIDLITTIIGINLGATERNFIARYLFTFGNIGYIFTLIFGAITILIIFYSIIIIITFLYKKMVGEELPENLKIFMCCLFTSIYVLLELNTIINNIYVITLLI